MMTDDVRQQPPSGRLMLSLGLVSILGFLVFHLPAFAEEEDKEIVEYQQMKTEIVPVQQLIKQVEKEFDGIILEIELEQEDVQWIYEVKLLTPQGNVLEVEYDAKTMNRLKVKGRRDHFQRPPGTP